MRASALRDPLAFVAAQAKRVRAPQAWREDLIAAGCLALVEAERTHAEALGASWYAYAAVKVRYGILDERRRLDAQQGRSRWSSPEEWPSFVSLEDWGRAEAFAAEVCLQRFPDALEEAERTERVHRLAEAIDTLGDRHRLVVSLHYLEDLTYREIGRVLDVTESRVCYMHAEAMARLRACLEGTAPVGAAHRALEARRAARREAKALRAAERTQAYTRARNALRSQRRRQARAEVQARLREARA